MPRGGSLHASCLALVAPARDRPRDWPVRRHVHRRRHPCAGRTAAGRRPRHEERDGARTRRGGARHRRLPPGARRGAACPARSRRSSNARPTTRTRPQTAGRSISCRAATSAWCRTCAVDMLRRPLAAAAGRWTGRSGPGGMDREAAVVERDASGRSARPTPAPRSTRWPSPMRRTSRRWCRSMRCPTRADTASATTALSSCAGSTGSSRSAMRPACAPAPQCRRDGVQRARSGLAARGVPAEAAPALEDLGDARARVRARAPPAARDDAAGVRARLRGVADRGDVARRPPTRSGRHGLQRRRPRAGIQRHPRLPRHRLVRLVGHAGREPQLRRAAEGEEEPAAAHHGSVDARRTGRAATPASRSSGRTPPST